MSFDPWERVRMGRTREDVMRLGLGSAETGRLCAAMPESQALGWRARA